MRNTNRQWQLVSYPEGMPTESNWAMSQSSIPQPGDDEMLVRAIYLDVAPYMRGRISPQQNYTAGVGPGDLMVGGAIGEVVQSNDPSYKQGDIVVSGAFGWQDFGVVKPAMVRRIDADVAPLPCWLDFLGINGPTAYFGLVGAAEMKPGDTVVISSAAGSVGQIAGQIAKLAGCRAIAITSSEKKIAWCRELGYDDGINYRTESDLPAAIARVCPDGVDVYFDNTAGPILDAVLQNLAPHARITVCGTVSLADRFDKPDIGERFMRRILVSRARIQGFLVSDYQQHYEEAWARLLNWYRTGALKCEYDIIEGFENTPKAFLRLLTSQNLGKQLVKVDQET